jgi:hypothetical protein
MSIHYICGEDNTVANALSRLPVNASEPIAEDVDIADPPLHWDCWLNTSCNVVLSVSSDESFLRDVYEGYKHDEFCKKLATIGTNMPGVHSENDTWYLGDCLVVPRFGTLQEDLFCLAHDSLGHFSADKSYASIRDSYYWPNMWKDLEMAYVPTCSECQHNKSSTKKPKGPLHPLPIPENCGDSVCLDFVGPLLEDKGFNCIITLTDCLGSDVHLIPMCTNISAGKLASLFFTEWYCENGLPLELISD